MPITPRALLLAATSLFLCACASGQPAPQPPAPNDDPNRPDLAAIAAAPRSEMQDVVRRFAADRGNLRRTYNVTSSPTRRDRFIKFYTGWQQSLDAMSFNSLGRPAQVDYLLLKGKANYALRDIAIRAGYLAEAMPHAPFTPIVTQLVEARNRVEPVPSEQAAQQLAELKKQVEAAQKAFEEKLKPGADQQPGVGVTTSKRVLDLLEDLRSSLREWHDFYTGYDPQFSWWCTQPHADADKALEKYIKVVKEKGVGITEENPDVIVGTPIGREALLSELASEMIPYTPDELIAIAEREFAWCEAEHKKAAAEVGLGDDWKAALERVKAMHVPPGEQPALVRDLAVQAIQYLREHDLVTVPALAEETWRMDMMSAEDQKHSPFFTGGEVIRVAFPTAQMDHEHKLMSLRGNNIHFSRATVQHELFPGHGLQQFVQERSNTHRDIFFTPFWTEGWALYWEMLLWDKGFPETPENRTGMLFWRSHRCARIIFSLKFQLGEWTPQQCIDFLVDRVGHERATAEAEVRRSVSGAYGPLYQIGYMIGGLQFRALHREIVGGGKMTDRAFHDAVLALNNMPVEMVRAALTDVPLTSDYKPNWRFDAVQGPAAGEQAAK